MRKGLSIAIKSTTAPAVFRGMPVRVWNGTAFDCRIVAVAPDYPDNPDAWVWHPTSAHVREGIAWFNNRWHLLTTYYVETCQIHPFSSDS